MAFLAHYCVPHSQYGIPGLICQSLRSTPSLCSIFFGYRSGTASAKNVLVPHKYNTFSLLQIMLPPTCPKDEQAGSCITQAMDPSACRQRNGSWLDHCSSRPWYWPAIPFPLRFWHKQWLLPWLQSNMGRHSIFCRGFEVQLSTTCQ